MLQLIGNLFRWSVARKAQRLADHHVQLATARNLAACESHVMQTANSHRHHRNIQPRSQHSDPGAKRRQLAVLGSSAFGKDQHAVPRIGASAGIGKALADARLLRQRKHVEQRDNEIVSRLLPPARQQVHAARRPPHSPQAFSVHADRELVAQSRRQRKQHESHIDIRHVIAGDQDRAGQAVEVLASFNARMRHDERRRQR